MTDPAYQPITASQIPTMMLPEAAGSARIIAGELNGTRGPANTFTPINVWDVRIDAGKGATLPLPAGHNVLIIVMTGAASIDGETFAEAEVAHLDTEGSDVEVQSDVETQILVLSGEPIDEPIAGYGPFVMNTETEIEQAVDDFNKGEFVRQTHDPFPARLIAV